MRAILQRVTAAAVRVDGVVVGEIGKGILALVGVERGDAEQDAVAMASKVANLRIFEDSNGKMNLSVESVVDSDGASRGAVLVVSQFTLAACVAKGRRPSFNHSAPPTEAQALLERLVYSLRDRGIVVAQGLFGARMKIELINDGPVTFVVETRKGKVVRRQF